VGKMRTWVDLLDKIYLPPLRKLCTRATISTMPKSAVKMVDKYEVIRVHLIGGSVEAE
jgi:hypothetical protein